MTPRLLRLLYLFLAALLAVPAPVLAQAGAQGRGFLWEATRGSQRVLLLGAIHVGRPEFAAPPPAEQQHLQQATVIAFEANVFEAKSSLIAMQRWGLYREGAPGLDSVVDKDMLARIETIGARISGGLPLCCRMKPWVVANTLVLLEAAAAGLSPAYGSEAQLFQFALATARPIVEIEGLEAQLRLFDETPIPTQLEHLRYTLDSVENGSARSEIERLVGAWERGDAAAMEQLLSEMRRGERAAQRFVVERLITGRHPKMVAAIDGYAGSGKLHLVVIGALHYFGPGGLLQGLRDRGFTVRRLY
jgi:uncharacterized protein YbaP (TraB family)